MTKWISVNDELPPVVSEISKDVLIAYNIICDKCCHKQNSINYSVGYHYHDLVRDEYGWNLSEPLLTEILPDDHGEFIEVTHWMPLPESPE